MSTSTRIGNRAIQQDERARKREAIGLAPERPTAKTVLHTPPDAQSKPLLWASVLLVFVIAVATGWMLWQGITVADVAGSVLGASTRPGDRASLGSPVLGPAANETLIVRDDFIEPKFPLLSQQDANHNMGYLGDLYQIQIDRPGTLAWTTLGQMDLGAYRLEADLRLAGDEVFAWGYGGLIVRFQNDENFYLFAVDGQGQYQVQLIRDGVWRTIRPWTPATGLTDSKQHVLAVADDGVTLRLLVDGVQVDAVTDPRLPAGDVGLVVGARSQGKARGLFDWIALYGMDVAD